MAEEFNGGGDSEFTEPLIDVSDETTPAGGEPKESEKKAKPEEKKPEAKPEAKPEGRAEAERLSSESTDEEDREGTEEGKPTDEEPKFKVKVDGEESEVPLHDLIREYQKGKAADKRFQEAAQTRQQVEELLAQIQQNPWGVFEAMGMNPQEAAEKYVWERYVESRMSPEQKRAWQERQRIAQLEAREAQRVQEEQVRQAQVQQERIIDHYTPVMADAMKLAGLPDTDHAAVRLIEALFEDLNNGIEPTARSLGARAKKALQDEVAAALGDLSPEQLESLVGPQKVRVLAQRVAEGDKRPKRPQAKPGAPQVKPQKPQRHFTTDEDFTEALSQFVGKGD